VPVAVWLQRVRLCRRADWTLRLPELTTRLVLLGTPPPTQAGSSLKAARHHAEAALQLHTPTRGGAITMRFAHRGVPRYDQSMGNHRTSGNAPPTGHPRRVYGRRRPHQTPAVVRPAARKHRPARLLADPLRRRPQRPGLAPELGVSEWTVSQTITTLRIVLPPRQQRLALQRRHHAEERVAARVASQTCGRTWPIG
jgi:hypothetical protein